MQNNIGLRIKNIREDKRLTQDYLAACLNVTQSNYGRLEKDDNRLTITKLIKIAEILEVKVSFLLNEKNDESISLNKNKNVNPHNTVNVISADQDHINSLKEEILFLRTLLNKGED